MRFILNQSVNTCWIVASSICKNVAFILNSFKYMKIMSSHSRGCWHWKYVESAREVVNLPSVPSRSLDMNRII